MLLFPRVLHGKRDFWTIANDVTPGGGLNGGSQALGSPDEPVGILLLTTQTTGRAHSAMP